GIGQPGAAQIGVPQVGLAQVAAGEVRFAHPQPAEADSAQRYATQGDERQVGLVQRDRAHPALGERRAGQGAVAPLAAGQHGSIERTTLEARCAVARVAQVGPGEVALDERAVAGLQPAQVGVGEVAGGEASAGPLLFGQDRVPVVLADRFLVGHDYPLSGMASLPGGDASNGGGSSWSNSGCGSHGAPGSGVVAWFCRSAVMNWSIRGSCGSLTFNWKPHDCNEMG